MTARVLDVREAEEARPGQQQQTVEGAHAGLEIIDGATCAILMSFVPLDNGGFRIEIGVAGSGPSGFGDTVAGAFRAAAETVGRAMAAQEQRWHGRAQA